jgi:hypothetical protein
VYVINKYTVARFIITVACSLSASAGIRKEKKAVSRTHNAILKGAAAKGKNRKAKLRNCLKLWEPEFSAIIKNIFEEALHRNSRRRAGRGSGNAGRSNASLKCMHLIFVFILCSEPDYALIFWQNGALFRLKLNWMLSTRLPLSWMNRLWKCVQSMSASSPGNEMAYNSHLNPDMYTVYIGVLGGLLFPGPGHSKLKPDRQAD